MEKMKGEKNVFRTIADVVPFFGVILGMLSGSFLGLGIVLAKYIYHVNPFLQLLARGLLHYAVCLSVSIYQNHPIIPKTNLRNGILLLSSAAFSSLVPIFIYTSFNFISAADTTAIVFTYPAIVALISALCLGDKCSIMHVVAVLLSVVGSILVARPFIVFGNTLDIDSYLDIAFGVLLAFAASVCFGLYLLTLRKLSTFSWTTLNIQSGSCLVVFSAIAMSTTTDLKMLECGTDGLVMVASGLFSTGGIVLTVLACKVENPRNVSVSQTIEMPVVIVFQVLIIGTVPGWNTYLGTSFIIVSVLLTWAIKWRETRERTKLDALNSQLLQESSI